MVFPSLKASGFRPVRLENKNYLINGGMAVAQRNPAFVRTACVDNSYQMADRWRTLMDLPSGTAPDIYSSDGFGVTPGGSRYAAVVYSNAAPGKVGIFQVVESYNMHDLRGSVVSLSMRCSEFGSLNNIKMAVVEWTGTKDGTTADPISSWNAAGTNPTLAFSGTGWSYVGTPKTCTPGTTWTRFTADAIGVVSTSANNIGVLIWADDTASIADESAIVITDVKLEKGPFCTEFILEDFATVLQQCQRYYWKSFPYGTAPAQNTSAPTGAISLNSAGTATTNISSHVRFPVAMRSIPSVTLYNIYASNTNWANLSASSDSGMTSTAAYISESGALILTTGGTAPSTGQQYGIHATAAIEL